MFVSIKGFGLPINLWNGSKTNNNVPGKNYFQTLISHTLMENTFLIIHKERRLKKFT